MKKLFLFLVLPLITFAQEGNPLHTGEFIISLINYGSSWNVTFTATAIDAKWDENYYLTSCYESATVQLIGQQTVAYFDLIIDVNAGINPIMALGYYIINAIENGVVQAYFYMDWRTCDYVQSPDVYFKYDITNKRFRNSEDTQTINGTTQTVWDLVSGIDHVTTGLELYLTITNNNSHPKLQFNAYHNPSSVSKYYIYKKKDSQDFEKIAEITNLEFTDLTEKIVTRPIAHETIAEYCVSAFLTSNEESLGSNIVNTRVEGSPQEKIGNSHKDLVYYFRLDQNYPNPFNSSTIINYELPENSFVTVRVYNSIGETVAELVNQKQEQGNYSIEFNALNLPSGIYLYKLQTDNFSDVKKMILIR
jgi:hypothetical protein